MGNKIIAFSDHEGTTKYLISVKKRYNPDAKKTVLDYKVTDYFNKASLFKIKQYKKYKTLFKEILNKDLLSISPFEQSYYSSVIIKFITPNDWFGNRDFGFKLEIEKNVLDIRKNNGQLDLITDIKDSRMKLNNLKDIGELINKKWNFNNKELAENFIEINKDKVKEFIINHFKYIE